MTSYEVLNTWLETTPKRNNKVFFPAYTRTLPTTVEDFYLWLVKRRPGLIFVFEGEDFYLQLSSSGNSLVFELIVNRASLMPMNSKRTHRKNVAYRGNDANFLTRAKQIKFLFSYDYGDDEVIDVYKELVEHVNTNLAVQYTKTNTKYTQKMKHDQAVAVLRQELQKLDTVFALEAKFVKATIMNSFQLPLFLEEDTKLTSFSVVFDYGPLTTHDEQILLTNRTEKAQLIRDQLEPFLDMATYVINLRDVFFSIQNSLPFGL